MNIETVSSYMEMSQKANELILRAIEKKNSLLLCAATGSSPVGTYQMMANEFEHNSGLFSGLRVIKLDEWGGIPSTWPGTCEAYLQKYLIQPLQISANRYISFNSNPTNPAKECETVNGRLKREGPIDVCILGLGRNGHLALNEPADFLQAHCHVANLSASSLQHQMISEMSEKPSFGLTLGMADIMASKRILLLVSGNEKKDITNQFLSKKINTFLPASFLWLHPNVICLINNESVKL